MARATSTWNSTTLILETELTGDVTHADVMLWREGLERTLAALPSGQPFKLLYNLHGYEPADLDAHKAMRTVIPELLAAHGMRPAVADLFDERPEVHVTVTGGKTCIGFANVHHDETKMNNYESKVAKANQRFFTDRRQALQWLEALTATDG